MTQYTTEDFARWGRQGGNLLKKTKGADYFSQIASMRKNPGRKKKTTLTNKENEGRMESNRANKRNEVV